MPTTLFLTLKTFSATGGIEKMCRIIGKVLDENNTTSDTNWLLYSLYDAPVDAVGNLYFPEKNFRGFATSKFSFLLSVLRKGLQSDTILLSHVNLLPIGWLVKKVAPGKRLVLLAHGIEIWEPLSAFKKKMLQACDQIIAVSAFTQQKITEQQGIARNKITVVNNCLDPLLQPPTADKKNPALLHRYGCSASDMVLLTLTRLAESERHKGYEKVITAMATLQQQDYNNIQYLIAGKYTETEKQYIEQFAQANGLKNNVHLTGFIPEQEMANFFGIADVYVMPSKKEGFGLIFTEAMYHGLPVIAGNADGSVDALANGKLGILVNPDSQEEITDAIKKILNDKKTFIPDNNFLLQQFGFESYKKRLLPLLN